MGFLFSYCTKCLFCTKKNLVLGRKPGIRVQEYKYVDVHIDWGRKYPGQSSIYTIHVQTTLDLWRNEFHKIGSWKGSKKCKWYCIRWQLDLWPHGQSALEKNHRFDKWNNCFILMNDRESKFTIYNQWLKIFKCSWLKHNLIKQSELSIVSIPYFLSFLFFLFFSFFFFEKRGCHIR